MARVPRGVKLLECGCYWIREKGKVIAVITCQSHHVTMLVKPKSARRPARKRSD